MCYIFSCFAWGLDFLQRLISFFLSCLLAIAICCGLSVAVVSGIAYGYNYSMAEYITFTRSDITVFMRRGAFSNAASLAPIDMGLKKKSQEDLAVMKRIYLMEPLVTMKIINHQQKVSL